MPAASDPITALKAALRRHSAEIRGRVHEAGAAAAAERLRVQGLLAFSPFRFACFSGFWPIRSEIDPRPLMQSLLHEDSRRLAALPVIVGPDRPLEFRRWRPEDVLPRGPFGTAHPDPMAATVVPDLVMVPLLAFDRRRHRLGYGGGYYDRTLRRLRQDRKLLAVGIAYAAQEVAEVPVEATDEPLDLVLTEEGAF